MRKEERIIRKLVSCAQNNLQILESVAQDSYPDLPIEHAMKRVRECARDGLTVIGDGYKVANERKRTQRR